ncbi:MAG: ABC transporter ATP-binding protein [Proteobacteria bacterium]|nr:ABC transporter ATP-binding protein [Pseudomonadota bacterium]
MPRTLFGYIWKISGRHQMALVPLSITVFLLSTVPLELQRRIVNDAIAHGATTTILWLAAAYAGLAMAEGAIKLCLNIYRSWVSESTIFALRRSIGSLPVDSVKSEDRAMAEGVEISMILSEAEPIGGFVGISISDPLLHGGMLVSVFGYLFFLEPRMALLGLAVFSPQLVFVPLLQRAIIVRGAERIRTLRGISGEIVGAQGGIPSQDESMRHVFSLSMGIFKLKFTMNFLMNLMHHTGVAVALGVGGWLAVKGEIEVGTVVAFVSGLGKVNDPWGDLVNWFREMTAVTMRYQLVADAMRWLAKDAGVD